MLKGTSATIIAADATISTASPSGSLILILLIPSRLDGKRISGYYATSILTPLLTTPGSAGRTLDMRISICFT